MMKSANSMSLSCLLGFSLASASADANLLRAIPIETLK